MHPSPTQKRFACFVPLIALGLEIAWCVFLFAALIFTVGDTPYTNTDGKSRFFDLIASLPVVAGVMVGFLALTQEWPTRTVEWICLLIGTGLCALWTLGFIYGLAS